jgi:hypothetical protein
MKNILKSKKGLSTVVTTLIILVVSVLLATVVTFYAINMTTTRTQQESLYMSNTHIWYNITSPGWAEAAFILKNKGGRDVVLQKITVSSQPSAWTDVFYNVSQIAISGDLPSTGTLSDGYTVTPTGTGATTLTLKAATGVITLKAGYTLVVYINQPGSVGQMDVGTSIPVNVITANAQWPQEVLVEAAL